MAEKISAGIKSGWSYMGGAERRLSTAQKKIPVIENWAGIFVSGNG
jgi:hypothetical protein